MQVAREPTPTPWRVGPHEAVLRDIARSEVHTTVWQRRLPDDVRRYAQYLTDEGCRLRLDGRAEPDPHGACFLEHLPSGEGRHAFAADIATCIHRYARAAETWAFRAELDVVSTDKCRRFHVDYYRLRWVCTYVGPGTEWLADEDVVAEVMRHGSGDHEAFNRAVVRDVACVRSLDSGDVLLMKGRRHSAEMPGFGGPVHRSPSVAASGVRRLVLTMTS